MKQAIVVLALIIAGSILARSYLVSQAYYPIAEIAVPEGLIYTAVQDPKTESRACGEANDRFLAAIKENCAQCQVLHARCEHKLEGMERALDEGKPLTRYRVLGPGLRLAITGPDEAAKAACNDIAGAMMKRGVVSAACVAPLSWTGPRQ